MSLASIPHPPNFSTRQQDLFSDWRFVSRYVGLSTGNSRLLLILMTVIWTPYHESKRLAGLWIGANKIFGGKALLMKTRRCRPAILLNWGGRRIARERTRS
jgi:hypothetical protein